MLPVRFSLAQPSSGRTLFVSLGLPALRRPPSWPAQYSEVVSNYFRMYFASSI